MSYELFRTGVLVPATSSTPYVVMLLCILVVVICHSSASTLEYGSKSILRCTLDSGVHCSTTLCVVVEEWTRQRDRVWKQGTL